jgi:hypothetical protein
MTEEQLDLLDLERNRPLDDEDDGVAIVEGDHCPRCGSTDLWHRPDGSKLCGPCVINSGTRGATT